VFHPQLAHLYCINEHDGSLAVLAVDQHSGALTKLQNTELMPPDFQGNALASDIHLTPDGSYLYASVRTTNSIYAFSVDKKTGFIVKKGVFEVEPNPRGFRIDPSGKFLVCAGQESNHIAVYKIVQETGELQFLERYPVGLRPSWIEIIT
jgi:6-phosphogluconolactonase